MQSVLAWTQTHGTEFLFSFVLTYFPPNLSVHEKPPKCFQYSGFEFTSSFCLKNSSECYKVVLSRRKIQQKTICENSYKLQGRRCWPTLLKTLNVLIHLYFIVHKHFIKLNPDKIAKTATLMILKCIRSKVRERSESKPVVYCFCFASLFAKDKICFVTLHFKNAHPKINLGEKLIWIRNITSFLTLYL